MLNAPTLLLQAPRQDAASYTDLMMALRRRDVGVTVVTGRMQNHLWLVKAVLAASQVPFVELRGLSLGIWVVGHCCGQCHFL